MKYCTACGAEAAPLAKFCSECGSQSFLQTRPDLNAKNENDGAAPSGRKQEFAGKITKCPNCGEVLKALSVKCPSCGFELQEITAVSSVSEFAKTLSETYSSRKKIELVRNFPIPNAKADIFEFLVLATSNFDTKKHMEAQGSTREMSEAWLSKIEQAYVKAESLFRNDADFSKFRKIYESDMAELTEAVEVRKYRRFYTIGVLQILWAFVISMLILIAGSGIPENVRLDATVIGFFASGMLSFFYPRHRALKLVVLGGFAANAVLNLVFCFTAPGHIFHVLFFVVCGLWGFLKNSIGKGE